MSKEYTIWQDEELDVNDWREFLSEEQPDLEEGYAMERAMYERNNDQLDDERRNLGKIIIPDGILCIAQLGLWNGTPTGYKHIETGKVSDCLYGERSTDTAAWYVDSKGEFRSRQHHHDGTNHIRYRGIKPGVSEAQIERLENLIYNGEDFESTLRRLTYRMGDLIGDVYGWSFPHRPVAAH